MISFRSYLTEARKTFLKPAEFRKLKSCSEQISSSKGLPAFRGTSGSTLVFNTLAISQARSSKNMQRYDTAYFNLGIELLFNEEKIRSRSSFCVGEEETAAFYGESYFAFYPNGYHLIYSPRVSDSIKIKMWQIVDVIKTIDRELYDFIFDENLPRERLDAFREWLPNSLEKLNIQDAFLNEKIPQSWNKSLQEAIKKTFSEHGYKRTKSFGPALKTENEIMVYDVDEVYLINIGEALRYYLEKPDKIKLVSSDAHQERIREAYSNLLNDIDKS